MSPRPIRKPKSVKALVDNFGFSVSAIDLIQQIVPKMPMEDMLRRTAKFLLKAESREELRWREQGRVAVESFFDQPVALQRFKSHSFHIPGGTYTPDAQYILRDGTRVYVEIKGSPFQAGYEASLLRLRAAATLFYEDVFVHAIRKGGGVWELEIVPPDKRYGELLQALKTEILEITGGDLEIQASFAPRKKATRSRRPKAVVRDKSDEDAPS